MKNRWWFYKIIEPKLWRFFAKYGYSEGYYDRVETKLEISFRRSGPGFRIHFGNTASDTPIDVMIGLYFVTFYWSLGFKGLGRFCEIIGRGHKRDISLQIHNGSLWWKLWFDDDMGYDDHHKCDKWRKPIFPWSLGRRKYRSWMCLRDGNIALNPLDAFWGSRLYSYEDIDAATVYVAINQFDGDNKYKVDFKLQKQTRHRNNGPIWARGFSDEGFVAHWECEDGIPFRNHSWKGDCVYASAVHVNGYKNTFWFVEATNELIKAIKEDRVRHDYRPPNQAFISTEE